MRGRRSAQVRGRAARATCARRLPPARARRSTQKRQRPVVAVLGVQREEHDALPLPEAEAALAERHLLCLRSEQRVDETFTRLDIPGYHTLEHALEVLEETGLTLLHTYERQCVVRCDVRDASALTGGRDGFGHLV